MITAHFTQFLFPGIGQKQKRFQVSDDLRPHLEAIKSAGLRLECEILSTGIVSFTITHPDDGDLFIELSSNDPKVEETIDKLIRGFLPTTQKKKDGVL